MKFKNYIEEDKDNKARWGKKPKKKNPRSNHPHEYINILLNINRKDPLDSSKVLNTTYKAIVCPVCGKVRDVVTMEHLPNRRLLLYSSLSREEMINLYSDLLYFELKDRTYDTIYDICKIGRIDIIQMYRNLIPKDDISDEDIIKALRAGVKPTNI